MFLHFIPKLNWEETAYGTYKDVVSRVEWCRKNIEGYQQVFTTSDDPAFVDSIYEADKSIQGSLVEYSYHSRIVRRIRELWPDITIAVRCINIEPLQHFDNHGFWPRRGPLWLLYGMMRLAYADMQSKRLADVLLCINDWEIRRYWRWLPGRAKVEWLPYRCPDHLMPAKPLPYAERRIIACMPTSQKNRKSWDLVTRFQKLAIAMKQHGSQDEFVITGNLRDWNLPDCKDATQIGFVGDLAAFAGTCKAVALLSPLGYGFKTTIGDALAAGAHVLVHPKLACRNPDEVRRHLFTVNTENLHSVENIMNRLDQPPDGLSGHNALKQLSEKLMRKWFGSEEA